MLYCSEGRKGEALIQYLKDWVSDEERKTSAGKNFQSLGNKGLLGDPVIFK